MLWSPLFGELRTPEQKLETIGNIRNEDKSFFLKRQIKKKPLTGDEVLQNNGQLTANWFRRACGGLQEWSGELLLVTADIVHNTPSKFSHFHQQGNQIRRNKGKHPQEQYRQNAKSDTFSQLRILRWFLPPFAIILISLSPHTNYLNEEKRIFIKWRRKY